MLHGGEQGGLGVPLGRCGFAHIGPDGQHRQLVPLAQVGQRLFPLLFILGLLQVEGTIIGRLPARLLHDFASGVEGLAVDGQLEGDLLILEGGQQHRQKSACHQVEDVALGPGQPPQVHLLLGGDDGMVVAHLGVVYQIAGLKGTMAHDLPGQGSVFVDHHAAQPLRQGGYHIVGDIAGVGAGVGEDLVDLIEVLHDGQGLLGGVGVLFVRIPLQLGQVVGSGRRCLLPGALDFGQHSGLSSQFIDKGICLLLAENTGLSVFITPCCCEAI